MTDQDRKNRICKNCDHFWREGDADRGECRAHPPKEDSDYYFMELPMTKWCGEWKAREDGKVS